MLIVHKYGGTSLGDTERIKSVARRVKTSYDQGNHIVVVVSARAGITNELIARAKAINPNPDRREMDMLLSVGEQETIALTAMALHSLGVPAVSRTGAQAGIRTDLSHMRARILDIEGGDIRQQLQANRVVIVAGFQGITEEGHTTTLGRGGSDLSAIAIAAVLKADLCQIYTDVDGIYTADPRMVPNARKIDRISHEEILELASCGAQVLQARAVELAQKYNVPFEVRSSFNDNPGTIVQTEMNPIEAALVSGVAIDKNQAKITVSELPDKPGSAAQVFQALSQAGIVVDMIVQNIGREGLANLTFTVNREDVSHSKKVVQQALQKFGGGQVVKTGDVAKLSVVGLGMRSHAGVAGTLFDCLAKAEINIQMISTSEIKIEVAIDAEQAEKALCRLHDAFGLSKT